VAKILVADDNSNVQKTVALALADLGVDVVSVNNGDAAVRKLADISPDLVLADIFMPVRNGYEVCEYVKKDSRFANVPVVLLVGAFDPLDEREAQRVGADGILKEPFVPPDPLINMVKTLLDRSLGDRLVTVSASKPAVALQGRAGGIATAEGPSAAPEIAEESPSEELHPPLGRVSFGEGERPIAFGQLLEAPVQESAPAGTGALEPVDDEQVLTSSRDASLGDPIFWKAEEPEPAPGEENPEADDSSDLSMLAWKEGLESLAPSGESDVVQPIEPFELVRERQDEENSGTPAIVASSASILQDPASQAPLTVEASKPEDLAANPIEWMATAPPPDSHKVSETAPGWDEPLPDLTDAIEEIGAGKSKSAPEAVVPAPPAPVAAPSVSSVSPAPLEPKIAVEIPAQSKTQPSLKPVASPPAAPVVTPALSNAAPAASPEGKIATEIPAPSKTQPSLKPVAQKTEDTARSIPKQDWSDLAASLQPKPVSTVQEKAKPSPALVEHAPARTAGNAPSTPVASAPSSSSIPASPDPVLVEAVVQRVLEKMRPQVVDIITKEFLRPVVQALVHREIEKR
jgi:CheY-like chemotaxis protein